MECISKIVLSLMTLTTAFAMNSCGSADQGSGGTAVSDFRSSGKEMPVPEILSTSSDQLTVGVRYVALTDSQGNAAANEATVRQMIDEMSQVWQNCHVNFKLHSFEVVSPASIGETYNPTSYGIIDDIRVKLRKDDALLMVATGKWGRGNNLGSANCYSSFPGDQADGIICETGPASRRTIMAHEVGHWFDLRHTNDPSTDGVDDTSWTNVVRNLMDRLIAPENTDISVGQCARARASLGHFRKHAIL